MMTGDQEQDALAAVYGLIEAAIDRLPRTVEIHTVKIEHSVGLDIAGSQTSVPASIECLDVVWLLSRRGDLQRRGCTPLGSRLWSSLLWWLFGGFLGDFLAR
jgi:hypothetical protein